VPAVVFSYSGNGEEKNLSVYVTQMRAWLCDHARMSVRQAGYSLSVLLSPVDLLAGVSFEGLVVLAGLEVDDLARLSVT
jgi:hypothetical protein